MLDKRSNLQEFALEASSEVIKLLKASDNPDLPVIMHVFDGAGCIMMEQVESLILLGQQVVANGTGSDEAQDLVALGEAIKRGGQVFDSGPWYLDVLTTVKAVGSRISNPFMKLAVTIYIAMVFLYNHLRNLWNEVLDRADEHWVFLRDSDIANRQSYIFSSKDELTNPLRVEEMIELRKKKPNAVVTAKRFLDSPHCGHLMRHPKEYKAFLEEFLAPIFKKIETQEQFENIDPDFSDYELTVD